MRSHNPSLRSGRLATTSQKMKASGSHRDHSSTKVSPIFLANDDEVHGIREGSSWSADPEAPIHHLLASCTKCSNQGFESCTVLLGFIWILLYDSCMKIFAEYRRIDVIEQKTMREALQKTWRNTGVSINFGRFLAVLIIPYHVNSSQCPVNGPKEYGCFASDFAPGNQEGQYSTNDSSNGGEVKPLGEGKMELAHIGSILFVCPCHCVCMGVCLWCFLFFTLCVVLSYTPQANQKKDRPHGRAAMPWGGVGVGISHMHLVGISSKSRAQMGCKSST